MKYSELKKIIGFNEIKDADNELAYLTHYLQHGKSQSSHFFKKKITEYISREVKETIFQESLNLEFDVPFPPVSNPQFTFIDLFAGIGGFRIAAQNFNGRCVFSSEIDKYAKETYEMNFGEIPFGDITKINENMIPNHDLLCAGFPCQPFSKGGYQNGFEDTRGTLFFDICRIIKRHKPSYLLLENVSNLATHDDGQTYKIITAILKEMGYLLPRKPLILSPDAFEIPVLRPRLYIPAIRKDLIDVVELNFDELNNNKKTAVDIFSIIDKSRKEKKYYISDYEKKVLEMWNDFYLGIDIKVIGFPIWADEFGRENEIYSLPKWKQIFILKNRNLYKRNKEFIDKWMKKYHKLEWCKKTHKKFEWQAGEECKNIYECLIQFRPSGVRAKRPNKFSTLVAMNHPQIVGKYKRRLTPNETKRLQSFPEEYKLNKSDAIALKQLGNSVNIIVLKKIIKKLLSYNN